MLCPILTTGRSEPTLRNWFSVGGCVFRGILGLRGRALMKGLCRNIWKRKSMQMSDVGENCSWNANRNTVRASASLADAEQMFPHRTRTVTWSAAIIMFSPENSWSVHLNKFAALAIYFSFFTKRVRNRSIICNSCLLLRLAFTYLLMYGAEPCLAACFISETIFLLNSTLLSFFVIPSITQLIWRQVISWLLNNEFKEYWRKR
jgi:hypothetical protein